MKQKNWILVAVAVVCGGIAAFLAQQVSARSKKQTADMVNIPQAAVDLPIGTKLKAEDFDKFVKMVPVQRDLAPVAYVEDLAMLKDKRVTRTMRQNDVFNPADVTSNDALNPPEGYSVMTVRSTIDESVAGFVRPGARVDVIASVQMKKSQKWITFPLFTDILILAVDSSASAPEKGAIGYPSISMISFAVDKDTSLLLQGAVTCGAQMRCALRHPDKPVKYDHLTTEQMWDIFSGRIDDDKKQEGKKESETPKAELVKVLVPKADLASGTEITEEFVANNFTEVEYPKASVPENTARNFDREIAKGYYLLKDVAANHFVPKSFLGAKPKDEPKEEPKELTKPVPAPAKKEYVEVTVNTIRGTVRHRYEKLSNGEFKYAGVVETNTTPDTDDDKKQPERGGEKSPVQ